MLFGRIDRANLRSERSDLFLDSLLLLFLGQLQGAVLLAFSLPLILALLLTLVLVLLEGILTDGGVSLGVEFFQPVRLEVVVNVLAELRLVAFLIVVGQSLHVLSHMTTKDVLAEGVGIEFLAFLVVSRETLLVVGDVETTIRGSLQSTKDTGTSRGPVESNIKESLEWSTSLAILTLSSLGELVLSVSFLNTSKVLVEVEFLESTAGEQETSGVGSRPVGQTVGDAISLELVSICSNKDLVTSEFGSHELTNDITVGEADDESVLWGVVLVLGLRDQSLSCIVIGLWFVLSVWRS